MKLDPKLLSAAVALADEKGVSIREVLGAAARAVAEIEAEPKEKARKQREAQARASEIPVIRASIRSLESTRRSMVVAAFGRTFTAAEQARFDAVPGQIAAGHQLVALLQDESATAQAIAKAREKFMALPTIVDDNKPVAHLESEHYDCITVDPVNVAKAITAARRS